MSSSYAFITILGLVVITVVTRSFFFMTEREPALPDWVKRGLKYAPIGALAAVVAPEVVMTRGALVTTWHDARLFAAAAGTLYFFGWRRDLLGTIVCGMLVLLPLRLGLGW